MELGIYERLLTRQDEKELQQNPELCADKQSLQSKADSDVLEKALQIFFVEKLQQAFKRIRAHQDSERLAELNALVTKLQLLLDSSGEDAGQLANPLTLLKAVFQGSNPFGEYSPTDHLPLSWNMLFAGDQHESANQLRTAFREECASANEICFIVSFIKWQGFLTIKDALEKFTARGGRLAVLSTTYIGATDAKALQAIARLPNTTVKICYDSLYTRLHAKAYIFKRDTGFGSAYVGSSNLSAPALTSGVEWNIKIAQAQDQAMFARICSAFDYFFADEHFEIFQDRPADIQRLQSALQHERHPKDGSLTTASGDIPVFFELKPYNFQQKILDKLAAQRHNQIWRNLVVAATGTGKTMIAAFDFKRFNQELQQHAGRGAKLLFIAHRAEILRQALTTFRQVLRNHNFGALMVQGEYCDDLSALFASVQSANSKQLTHKLPPDFYDYMVIDEVHHAAAKSYLPLLEHFNPKILLGLTATPDRPDGQEIFSFFDHTVSASIELPEAINRGLLCPFSFFGVSDASVDLNEVPLKAGDYDEQELERLFTSSNRGNVRADLVARSLCNYATDLSAVKALGFCVSIAHAVFMAEKFNAWGIRSYALSSQSSRTERLTIQQKLRSGEVTVIFTVDLFNEGVDIPEVNTVLFLRPTRSLTIFLQQLGRGLRRCEGKDQLLVLDFIAPDRRNFFYADRYLALLTKSRLPVVEEIKSGFVNLPAGCFIGLEPKAQKDVLETITEVQRGTTPLLKRLRLLASLREKIDLKHFLQRFSLQLEDIYHGQNTFFKLKKAAGLCPDGESYEKKSEKATVRLLQQLSRIDAPSLLAFVKRLCIAPASAQISTSFNKQERKWLDMLLVTTFRALDQSRIAELMAILAQPPVRAELLEIIDLKYETTDLVMQPLSFEESLDLYGSYSRDQLLTALNSKNITGAVSGLNFIAERAVNVLLVTLHKELAHYSNSTMYRDFSIDERHFHWQSPNSTLQGSRAARQIEDAHNKILLFVRKEKYDRHNQPLPYNCLGEVQVESYTGEAPISYTLKMAHPIPAKFLQETAMFPC